MSDIELSDDEKFVTISDDENNEEDEIEPPEQLDLSELYGEQNLFQTAVDEIRAQHGLDCDPAQLAAFDHQPASTIHKLITGDDRITSDVMSKFEFIGAISTRAKHLESGAPSIEVNKAVSENKRPPNTAIGIALQEMKNNTFPMKIKRKIGTKNNVETYEVWSTHELIIDPNFYSIILTEQDPI